MIKDTLSIIQFSFDQIIIFSRSLAANTSNVGIAEVHSRILRILRHSSELTIPDA
jgi:hypothetical protein